MKYAYPIVLTPEKTGGYSVDVPDLEIGTQGADLAEAIAMARDAIGLWGLCRQDEGLDIPAPKGTEAAHAPGQIATLVDVDFDVYRRAQSRKAVRRNVSLPAWLDDAATQAGVNCSAVLQAALRQELGL